VGGGALAEALDDGSALQSVENANPVQRGTESCKQSGMRSDVVGELRLGRSPVEILESMTNWSPPAFWAVVDYLHAHGRMAEALEVIQISLLHLLALSCSWKEE
jgi:hypothetical protein